MTREEKRARTRQLAKQLIDRAIETIKWETKAAKQDILDALFIELQLR